MPRRKNMYDDETEFWCVIKESGKRKEEQTYEEVHKRQKQATIDTSMHACLLHLSPKILSE